MTELRWNDGYAGLNVDASCKRIGLLIRQSGLSDKELAGMLGLSVQSVNKWRHGHHLPDVENLFLLGRILGRQVDDFLVSSFPVPVDWTGDISAGRFRLTGERSRCTGNNSLCRMRKYYTEMKGAPD